MSELCLALRQLRRSGGLAASLAVTVGLGVGSNLAVFALLRDALVPATPYQHPDRLVVVQNTGPYFNGLTVRERRSSPKVSGPDFSDLMAQQHVLSPLGAFVDDQLAVMAGADRPRIVCRIFVMPGLLNVLGVRPALGRLLDQADFAPDASGVALATDGLWRRHFGSDPSVVGRPIDLDEQPFTVVGVLPAHVFAVLQVQKGVFEEGGRDLCVVTPLVPGQAGEVERLMEYSRQQRDSPWLRVIGRLRADVSPDVAQAEFSAITLRLRKENPSTNENRGLQLVPLNTWRTTDVRPLLMMLAAAAALAFLVACVNATGLIITETVRREPEFAVRHALGASPSQLLAVVLVRSVLWSLPGAPLAFVFGRVTLALVRWGAAAGSEQPTVPHLGAWVLTAGLTLTLLAGLATGGVAAWAMRRQNLSESLRESGHTASIGRRRNLATMVLVTFQISAATALVIGVVVLVHNAWKVATLDRGFELGRNLVVQLRLPRSRYSSGTEHAKFYQQALSRVRTLPGVVAAGISASPPLTDTSVTLAGTLAVETPLAKRTLDQINAQFVTAGYFEALSLKLVRGRFFSEQDQQSNALVLVVDEAFCRNYLGGADPLASTLRFGQDPLAIIGVVGDVRQSIGRDTASTAWADDGTAYLLFTRYRRAPRWSFLVVRASGNAAGVADATIREVLTVDNSACLDDPRTFSQLLEAKIADQRRTLALLGSFAGIVLLLTALSLTAALAQFVAVHSRDIAIRLAIGANRRRIIALVSKHIGVALTSGFVVGTGAGLLLARILATQLYGVEPTDVATVASAVGLLVVVALAAAVRPTWRACRVNPASILHGL